MKTIEQSKLKSLNLIAFGGGGGGGSGGSQASNPTPNQTRGYAACDALSTGIKAAAQISGSSAAKTLAGEIQGACYNAVNNATAAATRSADEMTRQGI